MKPIRFAALSALFASSFALVVVEDTAFAKDNPPKGKGAAAATGAGALAKSVQLAPEGLKWGLTLEGLAKVYDASIDKEMLPLLRKAQPGPDLDALNEELRDRKGVLRRSKVDFGETPTGVDYTPLKGEYSYRNGESMASLTLRSGTKRYFFFFNDSLWKIYDEHKLKEGGTLGGNFDEALKVLTKRFGAAPKVIKADPKKGPTMTEAEWKDPDKIIRAVDRGDVLAMIYAERRIYENLASHRKNKAVDVRELDAEVMNVTKKAEPPPDPKDKDQGTKKK
jgi:hypothetical protein